MRIQFKSFLVFFVILAPVLWAAPLNYRLENGLQVVLDLQPQSEMASVRVLVKAGSMHEYPHLGYGLSHYLEHLVSGGSTSVRKESEYEKILENLGGASNAYTTFDHTTYFINTRAQHVPKAVQTLGEWMFHGSFEPSEIAREQQVIIKEMERSNASPSSRFFWNIQSYFYLNSPAKYPVLGYLESFKTINQQALSEYYHAYYRPNNMILVISGQFDLSATKAAIETAFAAQEAKSISPLFQTVNPGPLMSQKHLYYDQVNTSHISWRFPTVSFDHKDLYALDLWAFMAGNGSESIFYQALVESGLAYSVNLSSHTPLLEKGYFELQVECDAQKIPEIERRVSALFEQLRTLKIDQLKARMDRAKKQKISDDLLELDGVEQRSNRLALAMLYSSNPQYFEYYAKAFETVTQSDLKSVANQYLQESEAIKSYLLPNELKQETLTQTPAKDAQPTYQTLKNGVVLIRLPEDAGVDKAAVFRVAMVMKGGRSLDTIEKNGVSKLLESLMGKGSQGYSKSKMQQIFQDHGAHMTALSGNHTFSVYFNGLSQDFETLLPVYIDAVTRPQFAQKEIEEAKRQQLKSIHTRPDRWSDEVDAQFKDLFFKNHILGQYPMGTEASLLAIQDEDMVSLYQRMLHPESTVVLVSGLSDLQVAKLSQALLTLKGPKQAVSFDQFPKVTQHQKPERFQGAVKQDIGVLMLGYDGVALDQVKDLVVLDVLDAAISGLRYPSGPLHKQLRGKGLVYMVHAQHAPVFGSGLFSIIALSSPAQLDQAEKEVFKVLDQFKNQSLLAADLESAKEKTRFYYASSRDQSDGLMLALGLDHLYLNQEDLHQKRLAYLESVTAADVQAMAKRLFQNAQVMRFLPENSPEHRPEDR